jgi:hypothetical protein
VRYFSTVGRFEAEAEDALVAYFHALPREARRELEALAELDRRFGEDVGAEAAARSSVGSSSRESKP